MQKVNLITSLKPSKQIIIKSQTTKERQKMTQRKFNIGDTVRVNKKAKKDSYFLYKRGEVVDYIRGCYGIEFRLPGNGRKEYRRLNPTKLSCASY
jgi:hypothetical protein